MGTTFISYARADGAAARALYDALTRAGFDAWLDVEKLPPGSKWKHEIPKAIQSASAFVAVLSAHSVNHRGYVQHELKEALAVLKTVPANQIYLIPARLEEVSPAEPELEDLTWVDIFPSPDAGYRKIVSALQSIRGISRLPARRARLPSVLARLTGAPEMVAALRALPAFSHLRPDAKSGVYVHVASRAQGVRMPRDVIEAHPDTVLLVLQHQYEDLRVGRSSFDVLLWFSGRKRRVSVPFAAIRRIHDVDGKFDIRSRDRDA